MATNAILEAIRNSTPAERREALAALLASQPDDVVVPLVRNGRPMKPLTDAQRNKLIEQLERREPTIDIDELIDRNVKLLHQ